MERRQENGRNCPSDRSEKEETGRGSRQKERRDKDLWEEEEKKTGSRKTAGCCQMAKVPFSPSPSSSLGGGDRRGRRESLRGKFARYYFGRPKREKGGWFTHFLAAAQKGSGRTTGAASPLSLLASAPFRHCPKLCIFPFAPCGRTHFGGNECHSYTCGSKPISPLKM